MQRLGGLLLILSGVSLGAYTFLPPPFDGEQSLREVTRISAAPDRQTETGRLSWVATADHSGGETVQAKTVAPAKTAAIEAASDRPAATWSAIVTADPAQQARITSSKPGDDETRVQLTRDLQSELKRVGCYGGEVNGTWTPSTKRAMSSFMDRVNATLPIDEPDYILLTLVQGHGSKACGSGCPAGQTAASDGRCLPQSVIAARTAKKARATQEAMVRERARETFSADRVASLSEPVTPTLAGKPSVQRDAGSDERIAAAPARDEQESLPWLADGASSPAPAPRAIHRPEGMMAVGASRMAKADLLEDPAPVTQAPQTRRQQFPASAAIVDTPRLRTAPVLSNRNAAYQRGLPGTKSGPAIPRYKAAARPVVKNKAVALRRSAPVPPVIAAKPKLLYFAGSGRRGEMRPGSPAFRMLQAMGGVY